MSLQELDYVNLTRKAEDLNRSLPAPPYSLRPTEGRTRLGQSAIGRKLSIQLPDCNMWTFTGHLANPRPVKLIEGHRADYGTRDTKYEEGNENEDVDDDEDEL